MQASEISQSSYFKCKCDWTRPQTNL